MHHMHIPLIKELKQTPVLYLVNNSYSTLIICMDKIYITDC